MSKGRTGPARQWREVAAPAVIALMSVTATLGFVGVFDEWSFLPSAASGAAIAVVVAVVGRRLAERRPGRIGSLDVALGSVVLATAVGPGAALGVPWAFGRFLDAVVTGWSDVLTTAPPVDAGGGLRALPYVVAWCGATLGCLMASTRRIPGLGALGPIVAFGLASLVTLERRGVALTQGLVLALGALLLIVLADTAPSGTTQPGDTVRITRAASVRLSVPMDRRARAIGSVFAVVIATLAVLVGPRLPLASAHDRFDLREVNDPPFDPLATPSPLVQLKAALQDANSDTMVFRIDSDEQLDRFRLAALDDYTSEFWAVGRPGEAAARFVPVDDRLTPPVDVELDRWRTVDATVTIGGLDDLAGGEYDPPWLPLPGWPTSITSETPMDVRYDAGSGTAALVPDGPGNGLAFDVEAVVAPTPGEIDRNDLVVSPIEPVELAVPQLRDYASDVLEGADPGTDQIEAIRRAFVTLGAYDADAESPTARPGHHLGRLAEFVADPDRVVGFEEQYAATAALIARSAGIPVRVVVGFRIEPDELAERWSDGSLDVLAGDISAWLEVRIDGYGWLPYDVTPPRDQEPEPDESESTRRPVAVPNPPVDPPPPALPPALEEPPPSTVPTTTTTSVPESTGTRRPVSPAVVGVGGGLLLLAGAVAVVLALKRRRTLRRRSAPTSDARIRGAWREVTDHVEETGLRRPPHATPREFAAGLKERGSVDSLASDELLRLADDLDEAMFHPDPRPDDQADAAWRRADQLVAAIAARQGPARRLWHRVNPRPLFHRDAPADDDDEEMVHGRT